MKGGKKHMINRKKGRRNYVYVVAFMLIPLIVISSSLYGGKAYGESEGGIGQKGFYLTVEDGLISISANDASLKEILEEIGEIMKVEVVVNLPEEERISVQFHRRSLADVLDKLSSNYGYIMNTEDGENKIARIFLLPKGKETDKGRLLYPEIKETVKDEKLQPEPFKFAFDPLESVQE